MGVFNSLFCFTDLGNMNRLLTKSYIGLKDSDKFFLASRQIGRTEFMCVQNLYLSRGDIDNLLLCLLKNMNVDFLALCTICDNLTQEEWDVFSKNLPRFHTRQLEYLIQCENLDCLKILRENVYTVKQLDSLISHLNDPIVLSQINRAKHDITKMRLVSSVNKTRREMRSLAD